MVEGGGAVDRRIACGCAGGAPHPEARDSLRDKLTVEPLCAGWDACEWRKEVEANLEAAIPQVYLDAVPVQVLSLGTIVPTPVILS